MKKMILTIIFILLGILCLGYGIIVRAVASGTGFFMVWLACGLGFFIIAGLTYFEIFGKLPKPLCIVGGVIIILGVALFISVEVLISTGFNEDGDKNLDYIIVLGAQIHSNGAPSTVLKYRLNKAIEYLNDNPDTLCIVSGGQGYNEPITEARGMSDYLIKQGIDENRIIIEDKSLNTNQNIKYSMEKVDISDKKVGVVTNNFHVYRATLIAKKQGLKDGEGIAAPTTKLYIPNKRILDFYSYIW